MSLASLLLGLCMLFLFLVLNGLFVAIEFAIIALRKSRVEEMARSGHHSAGTIRALQANMDRSIAGAQLGITVASLALGWLGEHSILELVKLFLSWIPGIAEANLPAGAGVALSFLILSMLHVVVGEQVPKSLALRIPERTAVLLAAPFRLFCIITTPVVFIMNGMSNGLLRLMGASATHGEHTVPSPTEFQIMVEESRKAGTLGKSDADLLKRALELNGLTVRELMVPRTRMDSIADDLTLTDVLAVAARTKHSKLPVYRVTRDNVIGVLNTRDLFDLWHQHQTKAFAVSGDFARTRDFKLSRLVRQAYFVPETMLATTLLEEMKARKLQMALVLDEFGATVGLVTLEDLVEQLVGDIWDEYDDTPQAGIIADGDTAWRVEGAVTLYEFNKAFGSDIGCQSHCTTIAGAVIETLDRQPDVGDSVVMEGLKFEVAEMRGKAIAVLNVSRTETGSPAANPASESHT